MLRSVGDAARSPTLGMCTLFVLVWLYAEPVLRTLTNLLARLLDALPLS